jgi:PIN domain nuclease of toxin-antitoxin system
MSRFRRSRSTAVAALAFVALSLAVAGCSGGGGGASNAPADKAAIGSAGSVNGQGNNVGQSGGGKAVNPAKQQTPLQERQIVRTATLDVTVPDVDRAARDALAATSKAGGRADVDDRSSDRGGRHAHLVLRVPNAALSGLMDKVVALGHENSRTDHGDDVTAQVADVNARVLELQISVGRLQDYLRHSGSISELVALESQLTQRQSELESTQSQQRALADQVDLATLTVDLSTVSPVVRASTGPAGFGSALLASLHALLLSGRVALALLGYLIPFLPVAAVAGFVVLRYRNRPRPVVAEPTPQG